jgi:hypothetical protein
MFQTAPSARAGLSRAMDSAAAKSAMASGATGTFAEIRGADAFDQVIEEGGGDLLIR